MKDARLGRTTLAISAPLTVVWAALNDAHAMTRYMPVSDVEWARAPGGQIRWRAAVGPKAYDVRGTLLRLDPERLLEYTYFDPITRTTRVVTIELAPDERATSVSVLESLNNEGERAHIEGGWRLMLANLKSLLERDA